MIGVFKNVFVLQTKETEYVFRVRPDGHLEHMYYGKKLLNFKTAENQEASAKLPYYRQLVDRSIHEIGSGICVCDDRYLSDDRTKKARMLNEEDMNMQLNLEYLPQEISSYGKGDVSEPFVEMIHHDGSTTCDFLYDSHRIKQGASPLKTLPSAHGDTTQADTLIITLKEFDYNQQLDIIYRVYRDTNVITRNAVLTNCGTAVEKLTRLMSMQLDFFGDGYEMVHFNGAWAREMHMRKTPCHEGRLINSTIAGCSSNRANPFFMLASEEVSEDFGNCYGFNLVYSGNHMEAVDVNSFGRVRAVSGINPENFSFVLEPGDCFESPEAVMTFSSGGMGGVSQNMHHFIKEHIIRGAWAKKERPVLLNSWEAAYFDIDEEKLIRLAKEAKECGMELFVMDDGWFGQRNDDTSSLGDWSPNLKKLPGGIKGIADKINAIGLDFGLWVEPEMVNEDSACFRKHPQWAVMVPGKHHAKGRNQMFLDYTNPEVREYITDVMTRLFSSANISYVKWDMNRIMSDCFSSYLKPDRQQEFVHRYMMGLYEVLEKLTDTFPDILFEGCASGGNRFDLGMLCYFPQIWASDDTDARERAEIQMGYSYGYPMSVVSAHVSACPNHQTLRTTPLETRFNIAAFGILGYECNLCDMKKAELYAIKKQVEFYKKYRKTLQFGDFYRIKSGINGNFDRGSYQWICVAPDKSEALACDFKETAVPNYARRFIKLKGLDNKKVYCFYNRPLEYNVKLFGDLINNVAPVHVKQDSLLHEAISKVVKMKGETEYFKAPGSIFNHAGINLAPGFTGTGYNEDTACFQDYSSRIYILEEE